MLAAIVLAACDGADGARGPCASGGQILGECDEEVETAEDACWKLVQCGVLPLESDDVADWSDCVFRIEEQIAEPSRDGAIACVDASSCDALIVNDSPSNPYEWPDCLELPQP